MMRESKKASRGKKFVLARRIAVQAKRRRQTFGLANLFPAYRKSAYLVTVNNRNQQYLRELSEAYLHKGLVLYVGTGVSVSASLPSWPKLIRSLTVAMMARKVESGIEALDKMNKEKYWKVMLDFKKDVATGADYDKPILMMARAIKDELGKDLPGEVADHLYQWYSTSLYLSLKEPRPFYFYRLIRPPRLLSSPFMDAIVTLARAERDVKGVSAIVNYNYDDLLDEKLRQEKVKCATVKSGRDRVLPGVLPCYHVHGVLSLLGYMFQRFRRRSSDIGNFVFSEDDYHAEYSDPYRWSNMTQMSLMGKYIGLFVGLSMEDPNIRRLIDVTHRQYPDILNYAILPRKQSLRKSTDNRELVLRNLFEQVETTSFEKIGVRVLWADDYNDVPKLLGGICRINGSENPRTSNK